MPDGSAYEDTISPEVQAELDEAVKIVGFFVPKGTLVVTMKGKIPDARQTHRTPSEPVYPNTPLSILINGHSASASEIVAGALQDYQRNLDDLFKQSEDVRKANNPLGEYIEKMAEITLLMERGGISQADFETARDRLTKENTSNITASAAPVINKGSQEAYQLMAGRTVDKVTAQLQATEKISILAATANAIAERMDAKLQLLIDGAPTVLGP
jgi:hypothetical protein